MFMFHHHLVRDPDGGAVDALRRAQLWMLDPHREPPDEMSARMADEAANPALAELASWAAFTHHGQ
jgi:hypothetical protein